MNITSPVSGCGLTAADSITIEIFNYEDSINVPPVAYAVTYVITGPIPSIVTEIVSSPANTDTILPNSTYTYQFTTLADFSTAGTYTITAYISLPGDINNTNDTLTGYVVISDALSVGGTVSSDATVCSGSNGPATLTLAGETGSVVRWEYSTDGGLTWVNIVNTTNTQDYLNLTITTMYRAVVQSGACPPANSAAATITVDPVSVGGSIATNATVCSGTNGDTLTLSAYTGSILNWAFSIDNGSSWTPIANTTDTLSYNNLTITTWYMAEVRSGTVCAIDTSTIVIIGVNPISVGGTVSGSATVCEGANSGSVTLSGQTGGILGWEYSIDGGGTWLNIANTTATQTYLNLTTTTMYRAGVQSGVCSPANSAAATITVDPVSVGGSIATNAIVCIGSNSDTLTLSAYTGSILNWAFSTDNGSTWTPIANTTDTLSYTNLTTTTWYIAEVRSGAVCAIDTSSIAVISVDPISVGGTVAGSVTVCEGANSGSVTLSGQTGSILGWEYSIDGGGTWLNIANTTATQTYLNLTTTTMYRAGVQSGVCSPANSASATITVDPVSVGGSIATNAIVCIGSNSDTLTLSAYTGSILNWAFSTDNGSTWTPIANTTDTLSYTNLTTTTWYITEVRSGAVCAIDTSSIAIITVDPISVGGAVTASDTVCSGSNYDTLTLSGQTGAVIRWEYSNDGGVTWISISNTDTMQIYSNLTVTRMYRAVVQSGACPLTNSTAATITVDPGSVGGVIIGSATVCSGTNGDTLTLSVYTGSVLNWEFSTDTGSTWTTVINSTDTLSYINLTTTTWYRSIVQSGVCLNDTSFVAVISVDSVTIGGTISGDTIVCSGSNGDTLTLSGHTGNVIRWEYSVDGGGTWVNITNTSTIQTYSNLTITTVYRALVQSGVCPAVYSTTSSAITVEQSVGGAVGNDAIVCSGSNSDTLTLSGHSGSILNWEFSEDGGITWTSIADTNTILVYSNLITPTMYRAVVQNGVCAPANSSPATIAISQSVGGVVGNDAAVCSGSNGGILTLSGYTGNVLNWVSSIDTGNTWVFIPDTTDTLSYTNLTVATWYAAVVQFGVCVPDTSLSAIITVYQTPTVIFSAPAVCFGDTTQFTNSSSTGSGYINLWDFADNSGSSTLLNPIYAYSDPGIYPVSLTVISDVGCVATFISNATVDSLPVADITMNGPSEFCMGNNVILSADSGLLYSWSTGDSIQSITIGSSGTYIDTVTDPITGCVNRDSVTITVYPLPIANAGNDTTISFGYSAYLNGSGGVMYSWSPGSDLNDSMFTDPEASPMSTTTYTLTVTDINGCIDTNRVIITVEKDYLFIISNILTPNGDGDNDIWYIDNIENYPDCKVSIYNRFGTEILPPSIYMNDWGGTYKGSNLPDGTYYYILQCPDKIFSGGVTILGGN